jgi:hypothetical protein
LSACACSGRCLLTCAAFAAQQLGPEGDDSKRTKGMKRFIGSLIFAALVTPASAAPITAGAANIQVGPHDSPLCSKQDQNFTPGGDAQARCIANVPGGFFDFFASANASFGRLGVLARADAGVDKGDAAPTISGFADGFASFSDSLTISAGSTAVFRFDVHGGPVGGNVVGAAEIEDIHGQFELVVAPGTGVGPLGRTIVRLRI